MRVLFFVLSLVFTSLVNCQTIRVSLFDNRDKGSVIVKGLSDKSYLLLDDSLLFFLSQEEQCVIQKSRSNSLKINLDSQVYYCQYARLFSEEKENSFKFYLNNNSKYRYYKGSFDFYLFNNELKIINDVLVETYLEGVLESESGYSENHEYYKVQAIISRTYALKNRGRHALESFDLCDGVHCQAYYHQGSGKPVLIESIHQTKGQILSSDKANFMPIFFHSNCGGQTSRPEDIWNSSINGYYSVQDTFCKLSSQAKWEKRISFHDWKNHLVEQYHIDAFDDYSDELLRSFTQNDRKIFLFDPKYGIPLTNIRNAFQLKSTFFNVHKDGEFVVLKGKGFGHGVGLCQQGAMKMSRMGYDATSILKYYFPQAEIHSQ